MRLQFRSLNHAPGDTINPRRPVVADATALILLPLSGHNGHRRTWRRFGAVVNDARQTTRPHCNFMSSEKSPFEKSATALAQINEAGRRAVREQSAFCVCDAAFCRADATAAIENLTLSLDLARL